MSKPNRVYVLVHTMMSVNGKTLDPITLYYDFSQRQQFIDDYLRRKDEWYTVEIKAYYADLKEIKVEDMLNAV
jgi:hypothetical protein